MFLTALLSALPVPRYTSADSRLPLAAARLPVLAVLSSEAGPHREALAGLKQELAEQIPSVVLSEESPKVPSSTRVIVAFGSKAALQHYDKGMTLIYVLAPGAQVQSPGSIEIGMSPSPAVLLKNLKTIHPALKRLGTIWQSSRFGEYAKQLDAAASALGLVVEASHLTDGANLPDTLRALYGKIDALWLPADPALLNSQSLPVFIEFSRANHVPLFVPVSGLVGEGATVSVGPNFREMGRLAGTAVRRLLQQDNPQRRLDAKVYCANVEIVIGKTAAEQAGLQIPDSVLKKAMLMP